MRLSITTLDAVPGPGTRVELDGHDITQAVTALRLEIMSHDRTKATLTMVVDALDVDTQAAIRVHDITVKPDTDKG
jgi:hypothetical protein